MTTFLTLGLLSGNRELIGKIRFTESKVTSDPDPNQNDMDPKHWLRTWKKSVTKKFNIKEKWLLWEMVLNFEFVKYIKLFIKFWDEISNWEIVKI